MVDTSKNFLGGNAGGSHGGSGSTENKPGSPMKEEDNFVGFWEQCFCV